MVKLKPRLASQFAVIGQRAEPGRELPVAARDRRLHALLHLLPERSKTARKHKIAQCQRSPRSQDPAGLLEKTRPARESKGALQGKHGVEAAIGMRELALQASAHSRLMRLPFTPTSDSRAQASCSASTLMPVRAMSRWRSFKKAIIPPRPQPASRTRIPSRMPAVSQTRCVRASVACRKSASDPSIPPMDVAPKRRLRQGYREAQAAREVVEVSSLRTAHPAAACRTLQSCLLKT